METQAEGKPTQPQKPKHYVVKTVGGDKNGKSRIKYLKKSVSVSSDGGGMCESCSSCRESGTPLRTTLDHIDLDVCRRPLVSARVYPQGPS